MGWVVCYLSEIARGLCLHMSVHMCDRLSVKSFGVCVTPSEQFRVCTCVSCVHVSLQVFFSAILGEWAQRMRCSVHTDI